MEIKFNDTQWHSLSQSEKDNITKIVTEHFKGASIVPHSSTPPFDLEGMTTQSFLGLGNVICDIAQAAAIAACTTTIVGSPIAVAACVAAAQAAGDACRNS